MGLIRLPLSCPKCGALQCHCEGLPELEQLQRSVEKLSEISASKQPRKGFLATVILLVILVSAILGLSGASLWVLLNK